MINIMKLKDIKDINAIDITNYTNNEVMTLMVMEEGIRKVAISTGTYGMNGGLFQGNKTGTLYKVTKRNTNLFTLA